MIKQELKLSKDGKEQVALALLFLRDFKLQGKLDFEISLTVLKLAQHLGVEKEYNDLMSKIPPMEIKPRVFPGEE